MARNAGWNIFETGSILLESPKRPKANKKMSKTSKIIWWIVGVVVVVAVVWWGVSRNTGSSNVIKIGFIGPLTGDAASIGTVNKAAIQVAVDEVNAAGGINGKQIQMIYEDGQCNAQAAVSAAQKLIDVDGIRIIIGGECSTESSAFGPMAMQNKVIMFSPVSSAPLLSNLGKYFFRDYPSDAYQGKFGAQYAYQTLGARKVAVLYHVSDYGTGLKTVFEKEFQVLGGQIIDEEGLPQTATDYRTALSKIKSLKPDLIYSPTYPEGATAMLTEAAQLGIATKFLSTDGWDDASLHKAVSGKGVFMYTLSAVANLPADLRSKILAISGGTEIPIGTANAYDAVKILAMDIAKVGIGPDKLADAIRATQYNGVSGHIAFDQNGDLTSAAYQVKQIENGTSVKISQ
jgi:branched-chain amino acid transport system substrate-binding protein